MKKIEWSSMSTAQLVEEFTIVAREQDQAILANATAKYNRLYDRMTDIADELRCRPGDQRRELMRLYEFPSVHVRLKAAIHTLAVAPAEARHQLEIIAKMHWFPQTADALGMLRAMDQGRYVPE
jgi:hypothetical protein